MNRKRPYQAPALTIHGDLRTITRGEPKWGANDGGFIFNPKGKEGKEIPGHTGHLS